MNSQTQIKFLVTIGSNDDKINEEMLHKMALELELQFNNANPNMRMHIQDIHGKEKEVTQL